MAFILSETVRIEGENADYLGLFSLKTFFILHVPYLNFLISFPELLLHFP